MNNNILRLGRSAARLITVVAAYSAGASTISTSSGARGEEPHTESGFLTPGSLSGTAVISGFPEGSPTRLATETTAVWPGNTTPPSSGTGPQYPWEHAPSPNNLSAGIAGKASAMSAPGSKHPSEAEDYSDAPPLLGDADLAAWKTMEGIAMNNPGDWLFRMQLDQDSTYQQAGTEPFIPVPEPASGVVLLVGLAGFAVRRSRSE